MRKRLYTVLYYPHRCSLRVASSWSGHNTEELEDKLHKNLSLSRTCYAVKLHCVTSWADLTWAVHEVLLGPRHDFLAVVLRVHREHRGGQRSVVHCGLGPSYLAGRHQATDVGAGRHGDLELLARAQHQVVIRHVTARRQLHQLIGPAAHDTS